MFAIQAVLGIVAGILSFFAIFIYIVDIFRGNTKPSRVTWWVLGILNTALAVSYYASGARDTIWIPVSYAIGYLFIGVLSLKFGEGNWERSDFLCLAGAVCSLLAWWFFKSPEIALYLIIIVDFFGLLPTILKSYSRPKTEERTAWIIATLASLLNVGAIETWTFAISGYPIYVFITNALVTFFLLRSRKTSNDT